MASDVRMRLRALGLRATAPRVAVYRLLERARAPLSHGEACLRLVEECADPATIYRTLMTFAELGCAIRSDRGDHVWRYELAGRSGSLSQPRARFECRSCGRSRRIPAAVMVGAMGKALDDVAVEDIRVGGRCNDSNDGPPRRRSKERGAA